MRFLFMRSFAILLWAAAVFILGVLASDARADAPVSQVRIQYSTTWSSWSTNRDSLCQWYVSMRNAEQPGTTTFVSTATVGGANGGGVCVVHIGTQDYSIWFSAPQVLCVGGSAPDTTKPLDQQCGKPPPTCPSAGQTSSANYFTVVSDSKLSYSLDFCIPYSGSSGGCGMTASGRVGGKNLTTGKWEYQYMGPLTTTGKVCNGNGTGVTDPVQDAPRKCDAGLCTVTVNGVDVCVKCGQTDTATNKTQTTVNADGSTTQTTTNTNVSFNDNSVTTNTTTTTTTTPAGGGTPTTTTKTDGTTESKDSYCQRNPNDSNCKDAKSSFAGSCEASFACEGDAVQCAIAKEQYKRNCEIEKSPFAEEMRQRAEGVSWDVPQTEIDAINLDGKKNIKVDEKFNLTMQTVASKLTTAGGAVCPTGQGVDFFAQHIEVSYEIPCRFATVVRAFVTLAAAFVAFRIFAAG